MAEETTQELVEINMNETEGVSEVVSEDIFKDEVIFLKSTNDRTTKLKQPLTAAPTYTPIDFYGQFAHYNDSLYVNIDNNWVSVGAKVNHGTGARTTGDGTGTEEITTGFQPSMIEITAYAAGNDGGWSQGTADGTANADNNHVLRYYNGTNWQSGKADTYIVRVLVSGGAAETDATISAIGATSFTINWSGVGVNTDYLWKAYA